MATTTITKTASANITLTAGQWLVVSGDGTYTLGPGLYNGKIVGIVNGAKIGPFADTQTVSLCASVTDLVYYTQSAPIGTYQMSLDPASSLITDPAQRAAVAEAGGSMMRVKELQQRLLKTRIIDSAVMSSPPTFTESADFASGSISGGVLIPLDDVRIHKSSAIAVILNTQGRNVFNPAPNTGSGLVFSFATDAPVFEIDLQDGANGCPTNLIVDGQFAQATPYTGTPPASGNIRRQWKFNFGSRKMRKIQVINAGVYNGIAGIFVGPNDQVVPWNPAPLGGLLCIADSYGGYPWGPTVHGGPGIGLMDAYGFGACMAQVGGTGYYNTNGYQNYQTRLQAWITAAGKKPATLLTMGGINDDGVAANTQVAINNYYAWCAANLPDTLHVVTGPWCPNQALITGSDKYTLINGWLKSALQNSGLKNWIYLDTIAGGWVTSAGTSVAGASPWITGTGVVVTFTAALAAATSGTLTRSFTGTTGTYTLTFSDGSTRSATLTNGSTAVSWTGAVTATATVNAAKTAGNAQFYISDDSTHPSTAGTEYLFRRLESQLAEALLSMV